MLRGNWRYILAAIGLAAAIAGSGVWVYYLDDPITGQASAEQHNAPPNPKTSDLQRIASALEAIEKSENSNENEERARRDLDAQEGAWRWAKWAVWVAAVQALLSGVGIAFVVQSLRQGQAGLGAARRALRHARVANEIARDGLSLQLRPWVGVTEVPVGMGSQSTVDGKEQQSALIFWQEFTNSGQSPAMAVNVYAWFQLVPSGAAVPTFDSKEQRGPASIGVGLKIGSSRFSLTQEQTDQWIAREVDLISFARVDYQDAIPPHSTRLTESTWRISFNGWQIDAGKRRMNIDVKSEGPQNLIT